MQPHQPVEAPPAPASAGYPLLTPVFPRFTPQEVLILNYVVGTYPSYATWEDILRYLQRTLSPGPWGGPTRASLQVAMVAIRAKLGEKKLQPTKLVTVYEVTDRGTRGQLLGYAWRG